MKPLKLNQIVCDAGTQSRANINDDAVSEYAERMLEGDKFPPVDVFFDGNQYYLADGFHRILAASRNGFKDFECNIHKGTVEDALWFAIGANRQSGVRRSAGDKRKSIELALAKFPQKTQQQIAEHVGCNQSTVQRVSSELMQTHKLTIPATRKGKDGKSYPTKYKKPEPKSTGTKLVDEYREEHKGENPIPPTNDDKWKEAFGGTIPEVFTHEHVVEFEATIADLQCLLRGECCEKYELEEIAENLKVCLKLVTKLAKEKK